MQQENIIVDNKVFVKLSGPIYESEANTLKESLTKYIENGNSSFVIDFSAVDYIDSAGLGAMVTIQKRAIMRDGGVVVKGLSGIVKELFMLTRVERIFIIEQ
jgi:anti-sigma B factor antagonist